MTMEIRGYESRNLPDTYSLIRDTVIVSYAGHYPEEAIAFFLKHHAKHNIERDAREGSTYLVYENDDLVGTGSLVGTNVRRVFVNPKCQGKGYGKAIMRQLEKTAAGNKLSFVDLDSSLPARRFYDSLSYVTLGLRRIEVGNSKTLGYFKMAKMITLAPEKPGYSLDGKKFRAAGSRDLRGEAESATVFGFTQKGAIVFGEYSGGGIRSGELVGVVSGNKLDFSCEQVHVFDEADSGGGAGIIEVGYEGRLRLTGTWKWRTKNRSDAFVLEEL